MRTRKKRGVFAVEFAFSLLVFIPLLLGTGVIGINLVRSLQTIQLARDAGHMYARGVDFSQDGNKTVLRDLGATLGLSTTPGQGSATVILTALTYVDKNACAAAGAADANGNPNSACVNFRKWVIAQRIVLGNSSIRGSNYGAPVTTGPGGVTVDPTTGRISAYDQARKSGAQAQFNGFNPYSIVDGVAQGLPSGQRLYVAEAATHGFNMPPFVSGAKPYSWGIF
jgi:hypothetical protein